MPLSPTLGGTTTTEVLDLGKALSSSLEPTDTLGRWIANYIAERMTRLTFLSDDERAQEEVEVAELILKFWTHRRQLPYKQAPLADIDAVESAIWRLSPDRPGWSYFGLFSDSNAPSSSDISLNNALSTAFQIDRLAGNLVHSLIMHAIDLAEENCADWVKHAEATQDSSLKSLSRFKAETVPSLQDHEPSWDKEAKVLISFLLSAVSEFGEPPE